jgi:hypothetical protein
MPRSDYNVFVPSGLGAGDAPLTDGNLDSADTTIPGHRLQLLTNLNGHTFYQKATLPNSLLNGRLRLFYKIASRTGGFGSESSIMVFARSQLPTYTLYMFGIRTFTDLATGNNFIQAVIYKVVGGTVTILNAVTLLVNTRTAKGTIMGEVIANTLNLYATAVLLTDLDSNAYTTTPPLQVTFVDTAIVGAGGFGFGLANFGSTISVEIDRFHVFEIT